jgi:hypothetical protein
LAIGEGVKQSVRDEITGVVNAKCHRRKHRARYLPSNTAQQRHRPLRALHPAPPVTSPSSANSTTWRL